MLPFDSSLIDHASDVEHSNTFKILNTLVDEGLITEERADYLKEKFKELHTHVLDIYRRDNILLKRARKLRSDLEREREQVRLRGEIARKDDDEIHSLRQILIGIEKELAEVQERESVLQVEALEFDRRKQSLILEREDAQAAEVARLRPKLEKAQAEINEMGDTIKELVGQYETLKLEKNQLQEKEAACKICIANFDISLAQARQYLTNVEHEPERAQKQLTLVSHSLQGARKELELVDEKIATQLDALNKLELQSSNKDNDHAAALARIQKIRSEMDPKRSALSTLNASLGMEQELRQSYQERLVELGHLIRSTKASEKEEGDSIEYLRREKERCMQKYKALQSEHDNLLFTQRSIKEQCASICTETKALETTRKELHQRIQAMMNTLELGAKRLLIEQAREEDFTKEAQETLANLLDIRETISERLSQEEIKRREIMSAIVRRQELSQDCIREHSRLMIVKGELQTKELYVKDLQQRRATLEKRLGVLMRSFQKSRHERSHKMTLIERFKQKISEVTEKMRIIERELALLEREDYSKQRLLIQRKQQCSELRQASMNLSLERNNQRKQMDLSSDAVMHAYKQVKCFNAEVVSVENSMKHLANEYTAAIEARNAVGIYLIDLNTALALLMETVKAQEVALKEGMSITNTRSEEMRRLKLRLSDLHREIELCRQLLPKVKRLEVELTKLNESIEDEQWKITILENDLTDPKNLYRWRSIGKVGGDGISKSRRQQALSLLPVSLSDNKPSASGDSDVNVDSSGGGNTKGNITTAIECEGYKSVSEDYIRLQDRTQILENDLNAINVRLREKELILMEVRELAQRISVQAKNSKHVTISLAKQINQYQCGIRNRSRQMMATVSELSLFQASSIQLQQEVSRLEGLVEEARRRMEMGEAPFEEAEKEFEHKKMERQYYAAFQKRQQLAKEAALENQNNPNNRFTTAEMRPNAYIPDSNELPIPKPFGPYAPLKPSFPILGSLCVSPATSSGAGPVNSLREVSDTSKDSTKIVSSSLMHCPKNKFFSESEYTGPLSTFSRRLPTSTD